MSTDESHFRRSEASTSTVKVVKIKHVFKRKIYRRDMDDGSSGSLPAEDSSKQYDVFLSHDWQIDERSRNNHERVAKVNRKLKERGYRTWFDSDKLKGSVRRGMTKGIDQSRCALIFLTKAYMTKVNGDKRTDNCRCECNYIFEQKDVDLITVCMDDTMCNPDNWTGEIKMMLAEYLFVNLKEDFDDSNYLEDKIGEIIDHLNGKGIHPSSSNTSAIAQPPSSSFRPPLSRRCSSKMLRKQRTVTVDIEIREDESTLQLLENLGLQDYRQSKITPQVARQKRRTTSEEISDLPWYCIDLILGLSHVMRSERFYSEDADTDSNVSSSDDGGWDEDENIEEVYSGQDILIAIFLCADNMCKRLLAKKLQQCHLSVPLLLPIIAGAEEGKFVIQYSTLRGLLCDIGSDNASIVSFIRLNGKPGLKTKLLNKLMIHDDFDTFFDRESEKQRMPNLKNTNWKGVVDCAFLRRSKCTNECKDPGTCPCTFKKDLLFLNSRGICKDSTPQFTLACQCSSVIVAFVDCGDVNPQLLTDLQTIINQRKGILILGTKPKELNLEMCEEGFKNLDKLSIYAGVRVKRLYNKASGDELHTDKMQDTTRSSMNELVSTGRKNSTKSIRVKFEKMKCDNLVFDHEHEKQERDRAATISSKLETQRDANRELFPLQSIQKRLWREECLGFESYGQFIEYYEKLEKQIIEEQSHPSNMEANIEVIKTFCSDAVNCNGLLFTDWLTTYLQEKIGVTIKEFLREVEQLFDHYSKTFSDLCTMNEIDEAMRDLFAKGYSLEILHCDVRQFKIPFVKSVFQKAATGNVFILSIVGSENSGKSVLLNALFGTDFSSSIDVPTEGINAQLVPVPLYLEHTGFDYLMVLDSRGLQGTRDTFDCCKVTDNELATLLLAVSDFTLLNFKGKSKTEIQNTLQMAVSGLLQMKAVDSELRLKSLCLSICHNIDEFPDDIEVIDGNIRNLLNEFTTKTATELGIPNISSFYDVLDFEDYRSICFPNLWKGSPPDATINPGYIAKVQQVKRVIERAIEEYEEKKSDLNIFCKHLDSVLNALIRASFRK